MRRRLGEVSLERALSKLGAASRSDGRRLVEAGAVRVDGRIVLDPTFSVDPDEATIEVAGELVRAPEFRLLRLHKPRGVVTSRSDPEGRATVFSLLPERDRGLVCVGRLDLATSGLLLLTSSTRLADWLTDPAHAIPRVYLATVRGRWDESKSAAAERGVVERGELLRAASVVSRKVSGRESHLVVTLEQGRNREVRRLLAAAGHEVTKLKRVSFGALELGDLPVGATREVSIGEARRAYPSAPLPSDSEPEAAAGR